MYHPKYFATSIEDMAKQVLPEHLFRKNGIVSLRLMDERVLQTIDMLRFHLNVPLTVNNWQWGGNRNWSGFRDVKYFKTTADYLNSESQHIFGRGLDFINRKMVAHEVRKFIIENKHLFPYITFLEVGPLKGKTEEREMTWVHFDCRMIEPWLDNDTIVCWSPVLGYVSEATVIKNKL